MIPSVRFIDSEGLHQSPCEKGPYTSTYGSRPIRASLFLEPIADAIKGLDHLELVIDNLEFLAQPLDVAVDRAVIDIDLIVIGRVHQSIAALDDAGSRRERLEDQEFGDRQSHLF